MPSFSTFLLGAALLCGQSTTSEGAQHRTEAAGSSRPSAVWATGPLDLFVSFPKAVDPALPGALIGQTIGYGALKDRGLIAPFGAIRIAGARLGDDRRTLILATDPHPRQARYRLVLGKRPAKLTEIDYDLSGIEAAWYPGPEDDGSDPAWKGWWPALNIESVRQLAATSMEHARGLSLFQKPGRLVLSALLTLPRGAVKLRVESSGEIADATLGDDQPNLLQAPGPGGLAKAEFAVNSMGDPSFLTLRVATGPQGGRPFTLRATHAEGQNAPRDVEREWLLLPWVPALSSSANPSGPTTMPNLSGGDPTRGQTVFFGEEAKCSQCHVHGGRGGQVGPDLTEIGRKSVAEIYLSISVPSAEIAPDYLPYTVAARDGRVLVGVVRAEGADAIRVTDTNARSTQLARSEIEQIRPSATSVMPVGLAAAIGEPKLRDLIAFLATSTRAPAAKKE